MGTVVQLVGLLLALMAGVTTVFTRFLRRNRKPSIQQR
jgi:hypothetical protein